MTYYRSLAIGCLVIAASVGSLADAETAEDRALKLAEANYLCTKTGSVSIDSGFTTDVLVRNSTNIYHGGNAKTLYVVDQPGGEGLVPEGAKESQIRLYPTASRRLSESKSVQRLDDAVILVHDSWGNTGGGRTLVIRTHEDGTITYRDRIDFGGGAGNFVTDHRYGECTLISSEAELPETIAMKRGLSGKEAEQYIDDWEADIDAMVTRANDEVAMPVPEIE
jgi:hypothetical protein